MARLIYHRRSAPTGSVLARALGLSDSLIGSVEAPDADVLIRWGTREAPGLDESRERVINREVAIRQASAKLDSLIRMQEAGVNVPAFSTDPEELTYPFLGRRLSHARGTDVVLCLQRSDYLRNPRDYYVQYVPTRREFRVHVAFGEAIRVQGKFMRDRQAARERPWIRNHTAGYIFNTPRRRLHTRRTDMAVQAVQALGLDFGAVDLLIGEDDETYILEVNTAPACSPMTATAYAAAFARELGIADINYDILNTLSADETTDGDTDDDTADEGDE